MRPRSRPVAISAPSPPLGNPQNTVYGDIEPYLKDFPFTVWAANTDRAAKNREVLLSYIRAYSRAVHWLYDPKNKDQTVDILVKHSKQDRKDSADTYDYFVGKLCRGQLEIAADFVKYFGRALVRPAVSG